MVGFLLRAAISALGLWVASQLLDGLHFTTPSKLALAAVLLGVVNAFVRPLAFILTLPITIVTLGLFYFVVSAACLALTARLIDGFAVSGWFNTIIASICISIASTVIQSVLKGDERKR